MTDNPFLILFMVGSMIMIMVGLGKIIEILLRIEAKL